MRLEIEFCTWDWKEDGKAEIQSARNRFHGYRLPIFECEIDLGGDTNCVAVSSEPLTEAEAIAIYNEQFLGAE